MVQISWFSRTSSGIPSCPFDKPHSLGLFVQAPNVIAPPRFRGTRFCETHGFVDVLVRPHWANCSSYRQKSVFADKTRSEKCCSHYIELKTPRFALNCTSFSGVAGKTFRNSKLTMRWSSEICTNRSFCPPFLFSSWLALPLSLPTIQFTHGRYSTGISISIKEPSITCKYFKYFLGNSEL